MDPQEPSGTGEAVKDRTQLSTLEEGERRLIQFTTTNLLPGLADDRYAQIEKHLDKEFGRAEYGIPQEQIDVLKSLVRKHNAKELNETIHNVFRRLEVGKRHEITTDEDKQAAGSVRQGGAPVDVQPKGPAPSAAAARMPQEIEEEISRDIAKWMPRRDQGPQKQDKDSDVYRIMMKYG